MGNSIKDLKKEINYIFGEIIDEVNYKQLLKPEISDDTVEAVVDEAVAAYEDFYEKIHAGRKVNNKKTYFKKLNNEIEDTLKKLVDKIKAL